MCPRTVRSAVSPNELPSTVRSSIRAVELGGSALVVALTASMLVDVGRSAVDPPLAFEWLVLGVPGVLALAALVGAVLDGIGAVYGADGLGAAVGRLAVPALVAVLALATLWWVGGSLLVVLFAESGGVFFGPVFALFTASALGAVVLARAAFGRLFPDGLGALAGRTTEP